MRARRSRAVSAASSPRWTDSCRADSVCERRSVGARSSCSAETSVPRRSPGRARRRRRRRTWSTEIPREPLHASDPNRVRSAHDRHGDVPGQDRSRQRGELERSPGRARHTGRSVQMPVPALQDAARRVLGLGRPRGARLPVPDADRLRATRVRHDERSRRLPRRRARRLVRNRNPAPPTRACCSRPASPGRAGRRTRPTTASGPSPASSPVRASAAAASAAHSPAPPSTSPGSAAPAPSRGIR